MAIVSPQYQKVNRRTRLLSAHLFDSTVAREFSMQPSILTTYLEIKELTRLPDDNKKNAAPLDISIPVLYIKSSKTTISSKSAI